MANPAVETALEKVRELLRPDGGDIILAQDGVNGSTSSTNLADASATGSIPAGNPGDSPSVSDTASPTALKLQLIVENSDCPECILPVEMLEPIALDIMSADLPSLASVSIIDPRVVAESAAQSAVGAKEPAAISAESSRHV